MNSQPREVPETGAVPVPLGVIWARRAGIGLGLLLIVLGMVWIAGGASGFDAFKSAYFFIYGVLVIAAPTKIGSETVWRGLFMVFCLASAGFVFVLIAAVMFDYMAAAERGERLGVPGFEGTLIFLALMQVPAALFARRPDLLD